MHSFKIVVPNLVIAHLLFLGLCLESDAAWPGPDPAVCKSELYPNHICNRTNPYPNRTNPNPNPSPVRNPGEDGF